MRLTTGRSKRQEGSGRAFSIKPFGLDSRRVMKCKNDAPGMKGCRSRNENGPLRDKRYDTHMGTIEKQYGRNFHVRSDMHLGNFLKEHEVKSLNDLMTGK